MIDDTIISHDGVEHDHSTSATGKGMRQSKYSVFVAVLKPLTMSGSQVTFKMGVRRNNDVNFHAFGYARVMQSFRFECLTRLPS